MADAKKIEEFIKECFADFGLNLAEYFFYDFDDGEWTEMQWADESGKLHPKIVPFAGEILGISEKDIYNCNEEAILTWLKKYPYFQYLNPFAAAYERTYFNGNAYDKRRLYEVLFDEKIETPCPTRFDYRDIKNRLINQLKDLNESIPGTYHERAQITKLQISTDNFCHFSEITEMVNSFISMIEKAISLFLKAVKEDLNDEEIHEYNFLVSVLGLRDRYFAKGYLYYSGLIKARELYAPLNEDNFRNSIIFKRGMNFKPWRCAEFIDDKELVKRYLTAMPEAKGPMREFAISATQFECLFIRSDAQPIQFSPEEEAEMAYTDEMLGEEPIPLEERAKEPIIMYVPKTDEELAGDDAAAKKLVSYCRPLRLGGLESKMPVVSSTESIAHIQFLLGKIKSNNFIDRNVADLEISGGGEQ